MGIGLCVQQQVFRPDSLLGHGSNHNIMLTGLVRPEPEFHNMQRMEADEPLEQQEYPEPNDGRVD